MIKKSFKHIFNKKNRVICLLNPFIRLQINSFGNFPGITDTKREIPIIVSLSSQRENFSKLPITLYSILNQSLKPDKIILWLDEEYEDLLFLPYDITQFIKNGLEIRFVKDIGSYTKAIYAFKEYSHSIIVIANDEIYYPKDWLKKLYLSFITYPNDIHVHYAERVDINKPYEKWEKYVEDESARYDNFLNNIGGILYPPNCFSKEILREDIFLKNAPNSDDIWFWFMALIHNKKIRVVKKHIKIFLSTNILGSLRNSFVNKQRKIIKTNKHFNNLLIFYKQNILNKLKKSTL